MNTNLQTLCTVCAALVVIASSRSSDRRLGESDLGKIASVSVNTKSKIPFGSGLKAEAEICWNEVQWNDSRCSIDFSNVEKVITQQVMR